MLFHSVQKAVTGNSWERTRRTCKDHLVHPTTLGHPFWACAQAVLEDTLPSPRWLNLLSLVCITFLTSKQSPRCCPFNPQLPLVNTEIRLSLLSLLKPFWRRIWLLTPSPGYPSGQKPQHLPQMVLPSSPAVCPSLKQISSFCRNLPGCGQSRRTLTNPALINAN